MSADKLEHVLNVGKVLGAHFLAISITFTQVNEWLKFASLILAIAYGVWKWNDDIKTKKNGTKGNS